MEITFILIIVFLNGFWFGHWWRDTVAKNKKPLEEIKNMINKIIEYCKNINKKPLTTPIKVYDINSPKADESPEAVKQEDVIRTDNKSEETTHGGNQSKTTE